MEIGLTVLITGILSLGIGSVLGYYARQTIARKQLSTAEGKALRVEEEANKKSQEIILEAKKKAVDILEDAKKKEQEKEEILRRTEARLDKKEEGLEIKIQEIEK